MASRRWPLPDVEDHNGPQWLAVKHCALLKQAKAQRGKPLRRLLLHPGWYVVRTCPCHFGERVTLPYQNQARAELVRKLLLSIGGPR